MIQLEYLDEIAREAFNGNYKRTGTLSTGERLYVAMASGRMRELCPNDSIPYAVERVGPEWMAHMLRVWRSDTQPQELPSNMNNGEEKLAARYRWIRSHPKFPEIVLMLTGLMTSDLDEADTEIDSAASAPNTLPSVPY